MNGAAKARGAYVDTRVPCSKSCISISTKRNQKREGENTKNYTSYQLTIHVRTGRSVIVGIEVVCAVCQYQTESISEKHWVWRD